MQPQRKVNERAFAEVKHETRAQFPPKFCKGLRDKGRNFDVGGI